MKTSPSLVNSNQDSSTRRREAGAPTHVWSLWARGAPGAWCPGGETNPLLQRAEAEAQLMVKLRLYVVGHTGM